MKEITLWRKYRVMLTLLGIFFIAGATELGLQVMHLTRLVASDPGMFVNPDRLSETRIPRMVKHPQLGWAPNPEFHEHDTLGFRNSRVPESGEIKVVTLGDSQTYGSGVHRPQAWPQQLGDLGLPTYSLAFGGFGPVHYLHFLDQALSFEPRLVITAFYFGNDLYDAYRFVYLKPLMEGLKTLDPKIQSDLDKVKNSGLLIGGESAEADDGLIANVGTSPLTWIKSNSRIYQTWADTQYKMRSKDHDPCFRNLAEQEIASMEHVSPTQLQTKSRLGAVNLDDVRFREGLRISAAAFQQIAKRVKSRNVEYLVLLIPTKERVYAPNLQREGNQVTASLKKLIEMEKTAHEQLTSRLEEQGISYLSLLPVLQHALLQNRAPYPATTDGHPTADGHQAIARCVNHYVHEQFPKVFDS